MSSPVSSSASSRTNSTHDLSPLFENINPQVLTNEDLSDQVDNSTDDNSVNDDLVTPETNEVPQLTPKRVKNSLANTNWKKVAKIALAVSLITGGVLFVAGGVTACAFGHILVGGLVIVAGIALVGGGAYVMSAKFKNRKEASDRNVMDKYSHILVGGKRLRKKAAESLVKPKTIDQLTRAADRRRADAEQAADLLAFTKALQNGSEGVTKDTNFNEWRKNRAQTPLTNNNANTVNIDDDNKID